MKRNIGIGLLIILNLTFIVMIIFEARLAFGLIVAELGQDRGLEVANLITNDILTKLAVASILVLLANYFLTKKIIECKNSFLISGTVTVIGVILFIPFLLSAKQSFLDYQDGTTKLQQYIDRQTIKESQIITHTDTVSVEQLDDFIRDIGYAKYKRGPWKYGKKYKIMFKRTDGSADSIFTNGQMFGAYKGKYFSTDRNVIDKYLAE